jgi:hypothetical protein
LLEILPHMEVEKFLAEFPCFICSRQLGNHTLIELETCRERAEEQQR